MDAKRLFKLLSSFSTAALAPILVLGTSLLSNCKHDNQSSTTKVIGGVEDEDTPAPVVAVLGMKDEHGVGLCTGSVVRHDLVLTAAHCVAKMPTDYVFVVNKIVEVSVLRKTAHKSLRFVVFPGYDPTLPYRMNADVAFAVFPPQTFAGSRIASFAPKSVTAGEQVVLMGFGDTGIRDDNSNPQVKRFVGSNVVNSVSPDYGDAIFLNTSTVGMTTSGGGQGDSGGALFNAQGQIVGVAHVNAIELPEKPTLPTNQYISDKNPLTSVYVNVFNPSIAAFIAAVMGDQNPTQATVANIKPTPIKIATEQSDLKCEGNRFCKNGWGWLNEGEQLCSRSSPKWLADKKGCSCRCG